ncbi:hypothetical protein M5K25_003603 [Dendrobium thyrsiflorum]|uniref:14-3-3 domain-containing protein n=1 Tax=Dendrobium thyrsiflorum TaxID=117978 RepID=A0ABD0VRU0_DENTH
MLRAARLFGRTNQRLETVISRKLVRAGGFGFVHVEEGGRTKNADSRLPNKPPSSMASTSNPWFREKNLHKAQIAIEAGRYGDSVQFMMEIVKSLVPWTELSLSERKFLFNALIKFLEEFRQALNDLSYRSFDLDGVQSEVAKFYSNEITEQMMSACKEMKQFIYRWLILSSRSAEAKVFYLTLNADVSCFLVELQDDEEVQAMGNAVIQAFKEAKAVAKAKLTWASPARLTLALHMSEFYTEILQMPEKGVKIAKKALARAGAATGTLIEEEVLIEINELMSKLREYIIIWTNDEDGEAEASTSLDEFLTGAILAQVAWPPDTSDKAATFRTQPAAKDAGTTGTISALPSKPDAKAGISTSLAKFVVGNIQAQVASPPDISDKAIPFRTKPAAEEVETSGTISALQSEPGVEAGTSESFSMPVASESEAGKTPESPPLASPPLPALQEVEPGEKL